VWNQQTHQDPNHDRGLLQPSKILPGHGKEDIDALDQNRDMQPVRRLLRPQVRHKQTQDIPRMQRKTHGNRGTPKDQRLPALQTSRKRQRSLPNLPNKTVVLPNVPSNPGRHPSITQVQLQVHPDQRHSKVAQRLSVKSTKAFLPISRRIEIA